MKVDTLNAREFDQACSLLAKKIYEAGCPDAIIGVRVGGAITAKQVYSYLLNRCSALQYYEVSASRRSSITKKNASSRRIFALMPRFLLDLLRVLEHHSLSISMLVNRGSERRMKIDEHLRKHIKGQSYKLVYLIDDAIDSGATIMSLLNELNLINPDIEFKVAVLVVTQKTPKVFPDLSLYRNILLRFPWSSDYKQ